MSLEREAAFLALIQGRTTNNLFLVAYRKIKKVLDK